MKIIPSIVASVLMSICIAGCGSGGVGGGSSSDDVQYAALGASDAAGVGASPLTNGYVFRIREGIEAEGVSTNLMNYGVPGIEIGGILDVEMRALEAGNTPDIVTLFTGGNDIIAGDTPADFERDLVGILSRLREIEGVAIFIADLPDLTQLPRFRDEPDADVTPARIASFNAIIARQAEAYNATLIRLSGEPSNDALISGDGFHPNDEGHQRIATLFLQEVLPVVVTGSGEGE